jgi:glutathione S-transferase
MILYYHPAACSLAQRIVINELNIDCSYINVDLKTKTLESGEDFTKINEKGAVPVLQLNDGTILTEGAIILQYLADNYNGEKLLPKSGIQRYKVLEWVNNVSSEIHTSLGSLFIPNLSEDTKELFMKRALAKLEFINKSLSGKDFLYGNNFSIADVYLFVVVSWCSYVDIKLDKYPNIEKFSKKMAQIPSVLKSLKEEGLV